MGGDDGEADTKAKPHSMPLRREKGLEDALTFFGRSAAALVDYGYAHLFSIRQLGAHEKPAPNRLDASHRVTAIDNEVEQHLLELHVVAVDRGQMRREFGIKGDVLIH